MRTLHLLLSRLLDVAYPRRCPLCGKPSDRADRYICENCFRQVRPIGPNACSLCGQPAEGPIAHAYLCDACRLHRPHFDRARAALTYESFSRIIQIFKYNVGLWLAEDIIDILERAFLNEFPAECADAVFPVPLHPARFRRRGYNQSAVLAEGLARRLRLAFDPRSLRRARNTPTQTRLSAEGRRANMRDAFAVDRPEYVRGRAILLIDDVMTTGATFSECARTLKQAGAGRVYALAIARGAGT